MPLCPRERYRALSRRSGSGSRAGLSDLLRSRTYADTNPDPGNSLAIARPDVILVLYYRDLPKLAETSLRG
jgi:hypothetical protein